MSKIGLSLSGSGTKLAAHIGVIKALEEENIKVDYIAGTSGGSIVASLYAAGFSCDEIFRICSYYCTKYLKNSSKISMKLWRSFLTGKLNMKGLLNLDMIETILEKYFSSKNIKNISNIKLPLAIPAVNLNSGEVKYFLSEKISEKDENTLKNLYLSNISYSENLASIVIASSSIPGIFVPKKIGNELFVDGGVLVNTPVSILKYMGADKIIAVKFPSTQNINNNLNVISVITRTFDIMSSNISQNEIQKSSVVIEPKVLSKGILDCNNMKYMLNSGYVAAKSSISLIK